MRTVRKNAYTVVCEWFKTITGVHIAVNTIYTSSTILHNPRETTKFTSDDRVGIY